MSMHSAPHPSRRRERGFVLAMLLALMTILGIFLAKGQANIRLMNQRELEEELIFRGESYAKALQRYQQKTGGMPTSLEQLGKLRPPVIRKLYKDPLTNQDFETVTAVQAGATGDKTGLPISGVRSKASLNAIKKYQNKELTSEWVFSPQNNQFGAGGGGVDGQGKGVPTGTKGGTGTGTSSPEKSKNGGQP